ncbi:MAG: DUF3134 domain-containing protein [Phormidium sp. BM_Day4_Bin.17]|nr:DUF3134 domain-containing protein [Phormidium sp. BM_Day4_Bin.17]UCJ14372.1 MAG: DUF3134 family protein [Phormidium sp. PBR-2020]
MNPSLRQLPRHEQAELIPANNETSLLEWLQATGRLIPREEEERSARKEELEELGLIGEEDDGYTDTDTDTDDSDDEDV